MSCEFSPWFDQLYPAKTKSAITARRGVQTEFEQVDLVGSQHYKHTLKLWKAFLSNQINPNYQLYENHYALVIDVCDSISPKPNLSVINGGSIFFLWINLLAPFR